MEENILKWSCDRRKFLKVMSSDLLYRVRLGFKLNSAWFLRISLSEGVRNYGQPCFFLWDIFLECENLTDPATVTARLISNAAVYINTNFDVPSGNRSELVGRFDTKNLKDIKLDIVFIFKQNIKSVDLPKREYLVKAGNLGKELLILLSKGNFTDITLKCGSEKVKVHKAILCARSPVFKVMLNNEMQENKTNIITIEDMDIAVFHAWIEFVYGDEVILNSDTFAVGLLNAAEQYQMKGLKEICIQYLEQTLSIENAVKRLEVANLYDDQYKSKVISYIAENLCDLKHTEEWDDLKSRNPGLALEVYSFEEEN